MIHPDTGEVIVAIGEEINEAIAERITKAGIEGVKVRTVLQCQTKTGVCAKCTVVVWLLGAR